MEDKIIKAKLLYLVEEAQKLEAQSGLNFFNISASPKEVHLMLPVEFMRNNFDIDSLKIGSVKEYITNYAEKIKVYSYENSAYTKSDIAQLLEDIQSVQYMHNASDTTKNIVLDDYLEKLEAISKYSGYTLDRYDNEKIEEVKRAINYI